MIDTHKIGVMYVAPGQEHETDIHCSRVCGDVLSDPSSFSRLADSHLPVPNTLGCRLLSGDGEGAFCSNSQSDDSSPSSLRRAVGCCLPFLRGVLLGDECSSDFGGTWILQTQKGDRLSQTQL